MRTSIIAIVALALPLAAGCIDEPFEPSEPTAREGLDEPPTLPERYHVDPIRVPGAAPAPPLDVDEMGLAAPWTHEDPLHPDDRADSGEPVRDAVELGRRARARYDALVAARLAR